MPNRRHINLREPLPNIEARHVAHKSPTQVMPFTKTEFVVKHNNEGFISKEDLPSSKPIKVLIGDSVPECLFVEEDKRLERLLSEHNSGTLYLNHGISYANSVDVINVVVNKILPLHVSEMLLLQGHMDYYGVYTPTDDRYTIAGRQATTTALNYLEQRRVLLEGIATLTTGFGIKLILATAAHRHNPNDPYLNGEKSTWLGDEFKERAKQWVMINEVTRKVAYKYNLPLLDLEKIMYNEFELLYDYNHMNEAGTEFVVKELIKIGF